MTKGAKARHDAAEVKRHLYNARAWGVITAAYEATGATMAAAMVEHPSAHADAVASCGFLTPGAYALAFAKGYRSMTVTDSA